MLAVARSVSIKSATLIWQDDVRDGLLHLELEVAVEYRQKQRCQVLLGQRTYARRDELGRVFVMISTFRRLPQLDEQTA